MTENTVPSDLDKSQQPAFHTVKETAQHLRLCEKQIRRLIQRGELPAYQFGTAVRIKREDIDAYVRAQLVNPVQQNNNYCNITTIYKHKLRK